MAGGIGEAKQCFEVLTAVTHFASSFDAVSKTIEILDQTCKGIPVVGSVLGLVQVFLPDASHEEILRCFEKLTDTIDQVSDDIRNLEKMIKWEVTKIQYAEAVNRIQMAMQFSLEMGKANKEGDKAKYERFQQRLKEVCSNQEMTLAVDALLDGIAGKGLFHSSILDNIFAETGGHRPKISALSYRLMQIVFGGMIALATYEVSVRGKDAAFEIVKLYEPRTKEAKSRIGQVLQQCMDDFEKNMLDDINRILDSGGENETICENLFSFMKEKYDWMENACVVYDDVKGSDYHWMMGSCVHSLNRNKRCAIVFCRSTLEVSRFLNRLGEVEKMVSEFPEWYRDAKERNQSIVKNLESSGIGWNGCAVIWSKCIVKSNIEAKVVCYPKDHPTTTIVILQ